MLSLIIFKAKFVYIILEELIMYTLEYNQQQILKQQILFNSCFIIREII